VQNIDCRGVAHKILGINDLQTGTAGHDASFSVSSSGFSGSSLSIGRRGKLVCHADAVCIARLRVGWGLTAGFAEVFADELIISGGAGAKAIERQFWISLR
jgi:hypothetical protein